jgi:aspartyl-tRNA(Asn)/glutamyl-tRNA(Gln) amidotransferase subunit A
MPDNLNTLTLQEALKGLKEGKFTSRNLCEACLEAITEKDSEIKAFITVLPEDVIFAEAKIADNLIKKEGVAAFEKYPLLGIPYSLKDNFSTRGIKSTSSSKVLENFVPQYESTVSKKLKEAGAILLGKTNMDAFAHGSSTETSDFFTTLNPVDPERIPGGSSGGSAASVAADMCIFSIGSETAGSIRCPASWTGTVGYKPTYGRVSRFGVGSMASSTDSPGPITKSVWDSEYVLNVIAGKDPLDATTGNVDVPNHVLKIGDLPLKGLKIGKPKSYFKDSFDKGILNETEQALNKLKKAGAEIIEIDLLDPKYSIAVYSILQRAEVSSNLARLDGTRYGNDRSAFGYEAKKRMMLGAYTLSAGYYDAYYEKAQKVRTLIIEDFKNAFKEVDVIYGPTMPVPPLKIGESSKYPFYGEMIDELQEPSSIAGICAITIPLKVEGLPIGVQFMADQYKDDYLLKVARAAEKVLE